MLITSKCNEMFFFKRLTRLIDRNRFTNIVNFSSYKRGSLVHKIMSVYLTSGVSFKEKILKQIWNLFDLTVGKNSHFTVVIFPHLSVSTIPVAVIPPSMQPAIMFPCQHSGNEIKKDQEAILNIVKSLKRLN